MHITSTLAFHLQQHCCDVHLLKLSGVLKTAGNSINQILFPFRINAAFFGNKTFSRNESI